VTYLVFLGNVAVLSSTVVWRLGNFVVIMLGGVFVILNVVCGDGVYAVDDELKSVLLTMSVSL